MRGETFFGFLAGTALGIGLGILFAPDKGEVTRRKLKEAAEDGLDHIKEGSAELAYETTIRARYLRKQINQIKKDLSVYGDDLKEAAREKLLEKLSQLEEALQKENNVVETIEPDEQL